MVLRVAKLTGFGDFGAGLRAEIYNRKGGSSAKQFGLGQGGVIRSRLAHSAAEVARLTRFESFSG
jgi:hypothetical protein